LLAAHEGPEARCEVPPGGAGVPSGKHDLQACLRQVLPRAGHGQHPHRIAGLVKDARSAPARGSADP
jgi:hypothetical protein